MTRAVRRRRVGVCRFCGCSPNDACVVNGFFGPEGCAWIDRAETLCSACGPAAKAEAIAILVRQAAGYRDGKDGVQAFHRGFVSGWFIISRDSELGRNPYRERGQPALLRDAWDLGRRGGREASRQYIRLCGPLENAPHPGVLIAGRHR